MENSWGLQNQSDNCALLKKPENVGTFGEYADRFVQAVLAAGKNYQRIDVVFDRYRDDTIKAGTRTRRTQAARPIRRVIESRDVPLPRNWANFLSLSENKADLGHFLSEELCSQATSEQEIVVAGGFKDEREVRSSKTSTDIAQLRATHEEADTRLVLHALNCPFEVVVVASKDTDVLVMLLAHFPNMQCEHLWMRSGTAKQRKYIPIRETFNNLPRGAAGSLLAFHALTGCDTTSFFVNIGKKTAWKFFKESHRLLSDLGVGSLRDDTIKSAEKFVCRMYGIQKSDSTNSARHLLFSKTWKPEALPPTHDALRFHLMRVHYQAMIWRKANCPAPNLPTPTDSGWKKVASELKPELMSLSPIPKSCLEVISCGCKKQCTTQRCKCRKAGLQCSAMCACHQQNNDESLCVNR